MDLEQVMELLLARIDTNTKAIQEVLLAKMEASRKADQDEWKAWREEMAARTEEPHGKKSNSKETKRRWPAKKWWREKADLSRQET
jgi:hypothetical protein